MSALLTYERKRCVWSLIVNIEWPNVIVASCYFSCHRFANDVLQISCCHASQLHNYILVFLPVAYKTPSSSISTSYMEQLIDVYWHFPNDNLSKSCTSKHGVMYRAELIMDHQDKKYSIITILALIDKIPISNNEAASCSKHRLFYTKISIYRRICWLTIIENKKRTSYYASSVHAS